MDTDTAPEFQVVCNYSPPIFGSVANFGRLRMNALRWTQLSSDRRELLECRLARRLELSLVDHVRDFDAI